MKKFKPFISLIILALLFVLGYATYKLSESQINQAALHMPVQRVSANVALSPAPVMELTAYRAQREQMRQEDMQTLQSLLDNGVGTQSFLHDVAKQLANIIAARETELAIEGVLVASGFNPCLCVVSQDSMTIIVSKESLTQGEAAAILTLCESHTDISLENIKIMTGDMV